MIYFRQITLCAILSLLSSSCVGNFRLFNKLAKWNSETISNKWAAEAIYIGLNVIPVYGFCYIVDAILLNSIEFWGGENVLSILEKDEKDEVTLTKIDQETVLIESKKIGTLRARITEKNTVEFQGALGQKVKIKKLKNRYQISSNGHTEYYHPNSTKTK